MVWRAAKSVLVEKSRNYNGLGALAGIDVHLSRKYNGLANRTLQMYNLKTLITVRVLCWDNFVRKFKTTEENRIQHMSKSF